MAKWCGPCHAIAPRVEQLSQQYADVTFIKVDVDQLRVSAEASVLSGYTIVQYLIFAGGASKDWRATMASQDVAQACGIRAMPTFQFYKNNQMVAEFSGANPARLEELVKTHRTEGAAGGSAGGAALAVESTTTVAGTMVRPCLAARRARRGGRSRTIAIPLVHRGTVARWTSPT